MPVEAGSGPGRLDVDAHVAAMGFGFTQLLVTAYAAACWYADAGEVMILSYLAPAVRCSWSLGAGAEASLSSIVFASMLVGVPLLGALADRRGRRQALMLSMVIMVVAGLASAAAPSFLGLAVARAFVGFALGGTPVAVTLMAESIPHASRGRWLMAMQGAWTAGAIGAALVAGASFLATRAIGSAGQAAGDLAGAAAAALNGSRLLLGDEPATSIASSPLPDGLPVASSASMSLGPPDASPSTAGWRVLLVAAAIPLVLLLPATRALPESAHWLMSHGRLLEARETLECAAAVNARWNARLGAALGTLMGVSAGGRGGGQAPTGVWVDPQPERQREHHQHAQRHMPNGQAATCTGSAYGGSDPFDGGGGSGASGASGASVAAGGSGASGTLGGQPAGTVRRPGSQGAGGGCPPQTRGRAHPGQRDDLGPVLRTISFPPSPAVERVRRARSASASRSLARPPLPPKKDVAKSGSTRSRSSSPVRMPRRVPESCEITPMVASPGLGASSGSSSGGSPATPPLSSPNVPLLSHGAPSPLSPSTASSLDAVAFPGPPPPAGAHSVGALLRTLYGPELLRTTLLLDLVWFVCALTYYCLVLMTAALSSSSGETTCDPRGGLALEWEDYLAAAAVAAAEAPGLLGAGIIIDWYGRIAALQLGLGCAAASSLLLALAGSVAATSRTLRVVALFASRAAIEAAFSVLYVFTPELYPTRARSLGLALCNAHSRLGGVLAPYLIVSLLESGRVGTAGAALGTLCLLAALATYYFPRDTTGASMGETHHLPLRGHRHGSSDTGSGNQSAGGSTTQEHPGSQLRPSRSSPSLSANALVADEGCSARRAGFAAEEVELSEDVGTGDPRGAVCRFIPIGAS